MEKIEHTTVATNGINMHVASIGTGPAVLFIHGFPELWYSWRNQLLYLSSRGYRAIAPDLRGYGDTDAPPSVTSYTALHLVGDLIGLLDKLEEFAQIDTARLMKKFLCFRIPKPLCIPKDTGLSTLPDPSALPSWLSEEDVNYYASKFNQKGFTGPVNYYRCWDLNWELMAPWTGVQIKVPVKYIVGDQDLVYNNKGTKEYIHNGGFKKYVPYLQDVVVMEGVAHFINQEKAEEVGAHIYEFIKKF
ncbi:hypothetical protein CUMW_055940 [Citrus unshiu]|nr:hypothetical protein CUMW_055940 [Citrus unshiu]